MAKVHAITPIQHGLAGGEVQRFEVGDELSSLSDDEQRSLVLGGSAVEVGKGRKYGPEAVAGVVDDATAKRDALIAQANSGAEDSPVKANIQPDVPPAAKS